MITATDAQRLSTFHRRALEVASLIGAAHPSTCEIIERIKGLAEATDPWCTIDERRALTSVAARLHAVSTALLGMLGEHELGLPDGDDLAAGLADRGVLLPRKRKRLGRRSCR